MNIRWKTYSQRRHSNIEGLGEIPSHWNPTRLKRIGLVGAGSGFPQDEQGQTENEIPFYKVADMNLPYNEVLMQVHVNTVTKETARRLGATVFQPDTIIFPKVGAALLMNKRRILTVPSCIDNNIAAVIAKRANTMWLYYWLTTINFADLVNPGAVPSINERQIKELALAVPNQSEQRMIVHFLDKRVSLLDVVIQKKQHLIELLQEKRQALITQAVTKGLDPSVPMKDSGIEWLGEIPTHWDVVAAKRICDIFIPQRDKPELNEEEGIPWVTMDMLGGEYIKQPRYFVRHEDAIKAGGRILPSKSVVASCIGRFGISSITAEPTIINQQIQAYIPRTYVDHMFLHYCVQVGKPYFDMVGNSTTLAYVNREAFGNMPLGLPPIDEQRSIVSYTRHATAKIHALEALIIRQIKALQEYRQTLISAAVTGKIDVREEVAACL